MKLLADLHTHSNFSRFRHGKSSIEEMALEANEIGLVEIGITDHGYAHFFRTNKDKLKQARKIVDEINEWSKTKVLLGVEADIINEDGTLDIDNETLSLLDILIVSYHRMTSTNFASYFGFTKKTEEAKKKCTNAFVNAIRRYPVTIVAHLDSILTTDLYEIGRVCKERGTMVEINNRHAKWNDKQMEDLIASGCMFVVSSDAHTREKVGDVDRSFELIKKYEIPSERVANVEFEEEEMSEDDRKFSAYQSVYEQLAKTRRDREVLIETRQKTEITGKLSSQMEDELRKIAQEKGLEYKEYTPETVEEGYMKEMSDEDLDLIRQAEEYIRNKKLSAIQEENDEIEDSFGADETFSFEDDHPLLKGSFEDRFQPFNKNLVEEKKPNVVVYEENVDGEIEIEEDSENNQNSSPYEQLSASSSSKLQAFKDVMTGGGSESQETKVSEALKPAPAQPVQTRQVFKKTEPENFMGSITQTNLVNSAKPVEVPVQQQEKPVVPKPVTQRGGRKGGFITVDSLLGGNKK